VDIERYARWLQDVRCYQPSTVSRRLSVVVGSRMHPYMLRHIVPA
jgi:hypothetical protein